MILKLCSSNRWTPEAAKLVEKRFLKVLVRIEPCLRKCDPCKSMLVALLDGATVKVPDPEALVRRVHEALEGK